MRPVTVEWEESLGLEISISSEHMSLSLLPMGYGWHEAGPESDWQCVLAAETQAPHGWGLSAERAIPLQLKPSCAGTLTSQPPK